MRQGPERANIDLVPHAVLFSPPPNQRIFQHLTCRRSSPGLSENHGISGDATAFKFEYGLPQRRLLAPVRYETTLQLIQRLCEERGYPHNPLRTQHDNHLLYSANDQDRFPKLTRPTRTIQDAVWSPTSGDQLLRDAASKPAQPAVTRGIITLRETLICLNGSRAHFRDRTARRGMINSPSRITRPFGRLTNLLRPVQRTARVVKHWQTAAWNVTAADSAGRKARADVPHTDRRPFSSPVPEHPRADWNDLWLITSIQAPGQTAATVLERVGHQRAQHQIGIHPGLPHSCNCHPVGMCLSDPSYTQTPVLAARPPGPSPVPRAKEIHCDP